MGEVWVNRPSKTVVGHYPHKLCMYSSNRNYNELNIPFLFDCISVFLMLTIWFALWQSFNNDRWNILFFLLFLVGWDWVSWYCGHYWPIVPAPDNRWWWLWRNWWNEDWQGKLKYSEKTCPNAILSTTNPTWLDPSSNAGHRGGKPATNLLSYGAARWNVTWMAVGSLS
jgi:hypothetical protein